MSKTVTHIDCPKEWEITNDWDSHRPMLWLACDRTKEIKGDRVELGCGDGSTKLLEEYYKDGLFWSFETKKTWADKFSNTIFKEDYSDAMFFAEKSIFTFIDCAPGELRREILISLTEKSKIIIIHDTEITADYVYKLSDILGHNFKYRLDFKPEGMPATTAVSNFINVEDWV